MGGHSDYKTIHGFCSESIELMKNAGWIQETESYPEHHGEESQKIYTVTDLGREFFNDMLKPMLVAEAEERAEE